MKHLGDITKIKGCNAPVVDCIIGGSPCQDLSVAGKRAGLAGERSGLYMEQIRIIKEMRHNDEQRGRTGESIRPRYMVWENVPGAFSTNQGKDFAAVIEEAIRVAEPEAPNIHVPEKGWPTSGCFMGDNWSVAWRVLDAQFWGVPQRRRRIALVADFGGLSASEILFVRKSVSGDIEPGKQKGKETAGDAGESSGGAVEPVICIDQQGGKGGANYSTDVTPPMMSDSHGTPHAVVYGIGSYHSNAMKSDNPYSGVYEADKSKTFDSLQCGYPGCNQGGFAVVQTMKTYQKVTGPLMANSHPGSYTGQDAFSDMLIAGVDCRNATEYPETDSDHIPLALCGTFQNTGIAVVESVIDGHILDDQGGQQITVRTDGKSPTLRAEMHGNVPCVMEQHLDMLIAGAKHIVRRLTPLECERLQGYQDGWTDIGEWVDSKGKKHKEADSPRFKALGNSIAIPPWKWVLKRLCACYERDATMASLFDGIGGFPYIWEQLNGKGSCLWASEIEEFPMAVTKLRFGG